MEISVSVLTRPKGEADRQTTAWNHPQESISYVCVETGSNERYEVTLCYNIRL